MTTSIQAIRELPEAHNFGSKDTLVVFGELFQRGYANGVVDEAQKAGMQVIHSTVGRREKDMVLRPLSAEELAEKNQPLINIPLEAGFDLELADNGQAPVDQLKNYGLKDWQEAKLDWSAIEQSIAKGRTRFRQAAQEFMTELEPKLHPGGRLVFLHTMAGGFPRAKVVMPIANKVFKGIGDRFLSSEFFWQSEIGRLCEKSFEEVTAGTFNELISSSEGLRNKVVSEGGHVSYLAFGYHGSETMIGDEFKWYSYSPYLQGWAKIKLEDYAKDAHDMNINACVFNVPEILTNSSSIFLGIEVVIYALLRALLKVAPDHPVTRKLLTECESKLIDGKGFQDVDRISQAYLQDPRVQAWPSLSGWPQHNSPEQMELMRTASEAIIELHKDRKDLMTASLSELVFKACGLIMLRESAKSQMAHPVQWIGHDMVTKVSLS